MRRVALVLASVSWSFEAGYSPLLLSHMAQVTPAAAVTQQTAVECCLDSWSGRVSAAFPGKDSKPGQLGPAAWQAPTPSSGQEVPHHVTNSKTINNAIPIKCQPPSPAIQSDANPGRVGVTPPIIPALSTQLVYHVETLLPPLL